MTLLLVRFMFSSYFCNETKANVMAEMVGLTLRKLLYDE